MQIKATMKHHLMYVRLAIMKKTGDKSTGKDMVKREHLYIVGGNVNWSNRCGKRIWRVLKKLKLDLAYDPAIPLLGI